MLKKGEAQQGDCRHGEPIIAGVGNKKGRGETAPTFLTVAYLLVPVHPWSKA